MKTYRIITNGKLFRVQYRWCFLWFDVIENKGISIGGKFAIIKSKVEYTTAEEAVDWITDEQEQSREKWRVITAKISA